MRFRFWLSGVPRHAAYFAGSTCLADTHDALQGKKRLEAQGSRFKAHDGLGLLKVTCQGRAKPLPTANGHPPPPFHHRS